MCFYERSSDVLVLGDIVVKKEYRGKQISKRSISYLLNEILNFKILENLPGYYLNKEDALKMELEL